MPTKEEILQSNGVYLSGKIDGPTHEAILKSMDDWAERDKELFEWVQATPDNLPEHKEHVSLRVNRFYYTAGVYNENSRTFFSIEGKSYEISVIEFLKPVKIEQKGNISDAVEFVKFAFENYEWTGQTWDENTGHDDFESYTHEELYKLFKQPLP